MSEKGREEGKENGRRNAGREKRKRKEEERKGLIVQFQVWRLLNRFVTVGLLRAFTISLRRSSLAVFT